MKISRVYGDMSTEWLLRDKGEMIKNAEREQKTIEISESAISETKRKGALIYDIDATCGLSGRDIEFTDEKVIGSIDAPEINPDSKIIFATGDSMLPLIASGDRVVIRKIESWDYFNYGQVYLIITNEYRLIKRVRRHPKDADNLILLRSENPDYDDIDLPKREIIHLLLWRTFYQSKTYYKSLKTKQHEEAIIFSTTIMQRFCMGANPNKCNKTMLSII